MSANEKPLWIHLKVEFFEKFERREKDTEYRRRGPRWNDETCRIGRRVVLTRAYRQPHLTGVIVGFHYDTIPNRMPDWVKFYGRDAGDAACIKIKLDEVMA